VKFLELILQQKQIEIRDMQDETPRKIRETYSFVEHLRKNREKIHIIGEVKRASPSLGDINMGVDVALQARNYEKGGASAISVLTDESFFKGNIDDLKKVAAAVKIPVLNKDFILDKKQINRAINAGATMVLLIVAALNEKELRELYDYAKSLGLDVLVEVHSLEELRIAQKLKVDLIGVNNRNLKTFTVGLENSIELAKEFSTDAVYISESGFKTAEDVKKVAKFFDGVLVGETLMKARDIASKIEELRVSR